MFNFLEQILEYLKDQDNEQSKEIVQNIFETVKKNKKSGDYKF